MLPVGVARKSLVVGLVRLQKEGQVERDHSAYLEVS